MSESHKEPLELSESAHLVETDSLSEFSILAASERRTVGGEQASESGEPVAEPQGFSSNINNPRLSLAAYPELDNPGGALCNTPPSKSHNDNHNNKYTILSSGIDTLVLSVYVTWTNDNIFSWLEIRKKEAQAFNEPSQGMIDVDGSFDPWRFKMLPKGSRAYEFVLVAPDYSLKIARVKQTGTMPNVMIEIRSETLWSLGVKESIERILNILKQITLSIDEVKPSRVDLCVDLLMPEEDWSADLKENRVCRSLKINVWQDREGDKDVLETLQIGKGDLIVRIYDKEKEIRNVSKKLWMYAIWGINKAGYKTKIIRVEFQVKRPILKSFGIDDLSDLFSKQYALWANLTQEWIKFLEKPERNKDRQTVSSWWKAVQEGFGSIVPPLGRVKHIAQRMEQEQHVKRTLSYLANLMASEVAARRLSADAEWTLSDSLNVLVNLRDGMGLSDTEFSDNVKKKLVNYQRQDIEAVPF